MIVTVAPAAASVAGVVVTVPLTGGVIVIAYRATSLALMPKVKTLGEAVPAPTTLASVMMMFSKASESASLLIVTVTVAEVVAPFMVKLVVSIV